MHPTSRPRHVLRTLVALAAAHVSACGSEIAGPSSGDAQEDSGAAPGTNLERDAGAPPRKDSGSAGSPGAVVVRDWDQKTVPVIRLAVSGEIPRGTKVPGTFSLIEEHDGTLADLAVRRPTVESAIGIEIRGNFTATLPKKSYSIELRNAAGEGNPHALLGLPSESDWVLYAPYLDKSTLRNALVYDLGQELGRWNPRFRFVEVFLNDEYLGLYYLIERIKRDKNRVAVPKPDPAPPGDLTGGYIIRHEAGGKGSGQDWRTASGFVWTYHFPKAEEITTAQKTYVRGVFQDFETLMSGPTWADPARGYRSVIDVPSWVDYVIAQELTNNWDGYVRSLYLTKRPTSQGGKLEAGPLWDFDLGFGNINYVGNSHRTDSWCFRKPLRPSSDQIPFFIDKLMSDPPFLADLRDRWRTLRKGPLTEATLMGRLAAWRRLVEPAIIAREQARWQTLGKNIVGLNSKTGKTFPEEIQILQDWIKARLAWMDKALDGSVPPESVLPLARAAFLDKSTLRPGAKEWDPGYFAGTCGTSEIMVGLSRVIDGPNRVALCLRVDGVSTADPAPSVLKVPATGESVRQGMRMAGGSTDWAPGTQLLECGRGEYVAGLSQAAKPAYGIHAVLCAPASAPLGDTCRTVVFDTGDKTMLKDIDDWDSNARKGECATTEYMAGVGLTSKTRIAGTLLCCKR